MTLISADEATHAAQHLTGRHHPHYQGTTPTKHGNIRFEFKPFTGFEPEPVLPTDFWHDNTLDPTAYDALAAEYDAARDLWRKARYISALMEATAGASTTWSAYATARRDMDAIYASLAATADTHWRATILKLITAQETALVAAQTWDRTAREIAHVHAAHQHTDIDHSEAYERIGVDATDWVVGSDDDYAGWHDKPLFARVREAMETQREHLQKVANLTAAPTT